MLRNLLLLVTLAVSSQAAQIVYSNIDNDSFDSIAYSLGPYTEIGDRILLGGTARLGESAEVQFYNLGLDGTFDAILRIYDVGSPIGAQRGGDFLAPAVNAPAAGVISLAFQLGGLTLPDELIFTVELQNVTQGVDLGMNLFDPPGAVGKSSPRFAIFRDTNFSEEAAGANSNFYFYLTANDAQVASIPEPSSFALTVSAFLAIACRSYFSRKERL